MASVSEHIQNEFARWQEQQRQRDVITTISSRMVWFDFLTFRALMKVVLIFNDILFCTNYISVSWSSYVSKVAGCRRRISGTHFLAGTRFFALSQCLDFVLSPSRCKVLEGWSWAAICIMPRCRMLQSAYLSFDFFCLLERYLYTLCILNSWLSFELHIALCLVLNILSL
jgi:hypothetical protein